MGKGHRHIKHLKSEKAKVKLKTKQVKHLPKGQNVTDTSFKVKKIVIREQLKQRDDSEILSKRKLNIKDLLTRLQHHNSTVRQEAIRELKEILLQHSEIINSQFSALLQGIAALSLDKEKDIRRDSFKVLSLILSPISNEQLLPFCDVLISYLRCAMTHIDPRIKEDSLLLLDILIQNCHAILVKNSNKVLPNFLDMISRLHCEAKPGRQLMMTLNSRNTSIKWRTKVLERLACMLGSIINFKKTQRESDIDATSSIIHVGDYTRYVPIYNRINSQIYDVNIIENNNLTEDKLDGNSEMIELMKYINMLMPLMFDSWIEVCPEEKLTVSYSEYVISAEALSLLKHIIGIIQLITEYIDMIDYNSEANMKVWFTESFQNLYIKNLFSKFPFSTTKAALQIRKRQTDFSTTELTENCLKENLALCQIYIWFTTVNTCSKSSIKLNKTYCNTITEYLNDKIEHWSTDDTAALQQLIRLLKTLFLKASKLWYINNIAMKSILATVISACYRQSRKELQAQLFMLIGDIILDHTLIDLHSEEVFKKFVLTLPDMLLKASIHDSTIHMINRIVLRYRKWIEDELIAKHDAIIENAKTIEVIGSTNEKFSRLTICNLFYFVNGQIYY